jgi:hypothetical protein
MTRIEIIREIGDLLTRLDILRGGLLPGNRDRQALDDLRLLLDDRQRRLSQQHFEENTAEFKAAAADFARVNADVRLTIDRVERLIETINNVRRLLVAVDTVVGVALPVV